MKYINLLREGERIQEVYLCKQKQSLKTKAGKSYYSLVLQDATGTVDAKIWDMSQAIDHFEAMQYIRVDADVTYFQNAPQLNIRRLRVAAEGEYEPGNYLPVSAYNIDTMYQELLGYVQSIKNKYLKSLAESLFVEDEAFIKSFKAHSAAKSVHHGFVGGLMEHTLAVTRTCDYFAAHYKILQRDLLIVAGLIHDIGKVAELSSFPENDYTDEGQLLGHIVIGIEMISEKIRGIPNFPDKIAAELKHCILSHHGEFEYGSPKKPALPEAIALTFADNADAKLQTVTEFISHTPGNQGWLGYCRWLDSNIRKSTDIS